MAAGPFVIINSAKPKLIDGTFDIDSHTFKACLLTAAVALSATTTVDTYAEITSEITGAGYAAGGKVLSVNVSGSGTVTVDADDVVWADSTITGAKYLVVYSDTASAKDILGYIDLNTASGSAIADASASGSFTVRFHANGLFTLS